ncbi:hypothetical protein ACF073_09160 [Streptomyces sp. NPDC015171]|uniref:hypothetical protein n=1 Tax=Streptomyces sp. NPDC015171 TaxID=3364945 RepID=UPI0037001983
MPCWRAGTFPVLRLDFQTDAYRRSAELVLVVMLFADGPRARSYERLGNPTVERRLLGLAPPASVGLATLFGAALFPRAGWWPRYW